MIAHRVESLCCLIIRYTHRTKLLENPTIIRAKWPDNQWLGCVSSANEPGESRVSQLSIEAIIDRIDTVLSKNRLTEWIFISLAVILFLLGISCMVAALLTGKYAWASPSAVTTGLLYWPLREIRDMRSRNITVGVAPTLILGLPPDMAAEEMRKLLQNLYEEGKHGLQGRSSRPARRAGRKT